MRQCFLSILLSLLTFTHALALAPQDLPHYQATARQLTAHMTPDLITQTNTLITHDTPQYRRIQSDTPAYQQQRRAGELQLTRFDLPVTLNSLTYSHALNASWSHFTQPVQATHLTLQQGGQLNNSVFDQATLWLRLSAQGPVDFSMSTFKGDANFTGSFFMDRAEFDGATFLQHAQFKDSESDQPISFSHTHFAGPTSFEGAFFKEGLDLSYAKINSLDFTHADMSGLLNLQGATLTNPLDLTRIKSLHTDQTIALNILDTDLSKITFRYTDFKLFFPNETSHAKKIQLYHLLLDKFENDGDVYSYNALFEEFKTYEYTYDNAYIRLFLDKHIWHFGLKKGLTFKWLAMLFSLFVIINACCYKKLVLEYLKIEFLSNIDYSKSTRLSPIQRFFFFLPYAFILTWSLCICLFLPAMGITTQHLRGKSLAVTSYLMLMPATGLFIIMFIIIFILKA